MTALNKRRKSKVKRDGYRLALRSVEEWNDPDRMDDIVVKDVAMFRMEQMDSRSWWLACYLDDSPNPDHLTMWITYDGKNREIVVNVTEYPMGEHVYEERP